MIDGPVQLDSSSVRDLSRGLPAAAKTALYMLVHLPIGSLIMTTPEGKSIRVGGKTPGPKARLVLKNWSVFGRAISGGTIGVAESYMDGDWESPDVTTLLELFVVNREEGNKIAGGTNWVLSTMQRLRHWLNQNSRQGSRRNISAHYDLGNDFYEKWLDPGMTYSSALFSKGANDLETAQNAKYRAMARDIGIRPSDHLLEIGCGWGGFVEFAAREIGCRVTGITISREQLEFARERVAQAGLSEKVELKYQDYRDETGKYDRIASIEMFEAVGEKYWPLFFTKIRDCLKPGGTAGLQVITINQESFLQYRRQPDFIQRYIFPGGMLPTPLILHKLVAEHGLSNLKERIFPQDYARTLAEWRTRFWSAWPAIASLGFDDRFRKMWEFYLHYCEAGFRSEYIDVRQLILKART